MKELSWFLFSLVMGISTARAELLPPMKLVLNGSLSQEAGNSCAVAKTNNAALYSQGSSTYLVIESQNYSPRERHVYKGHLVVTESYCSRVYSFEGSEDLNRRTVSLKSEFFLARIAKKGEPVCALPYPAPTFNTTMVEKYIAQQPPTPTPTRGPAPEIQSISELESGQQPGNEFPGSIVIRSSGVLKEVK